MSQHMACSRIRPRHMSCFAQIPLGGMALLRTGFDWITVRLRGEWLPGPTPRNSSSTTFVHKGKKKGRIGRSLYCRTKRPLILAPKVLLVLARREPGYEGSSLVQEPPPLR